MIPLRDTIPAGRTAWVTRALVALNVAVFGLELFQGEALEAFVYHFGVVPARWLVTTPSDLLDWPRLFLTLLASQFLHGDLFHLGSNMLYLWIFGDNVEDRLGRARFLGLYLASGVLAAVSQILVSPRSLLPMVGASGAIAGVLGAYLLMFPAARIVTLIPMGLFSQTVEVPAALYLGLWFLMQWGYGLMTIGQVSDEVGGVAFWAHIGGFVAGMLAVAILRPRRRW